MTGAPAQKKASSSWWITSTVIHLAVIGLLFLIFPYQEFVKPTAREKVAQPLVNQKTLEATTRRIEEKQAEEMALKLRELEALTGDIQSVEVRQRVSHAEFQKNITQLSPELANDLATVARAEFAAYRELQKADQEAWDSLQTALNAAAPILQRLDDSNLKATVDSLSVAFKKVPAAQDKLNFAQAGLLETQQKIASRLGFIREAQPDLFNTQEKLVASIENTMQLGAAYSASFKATRPVLLDSPKMVDRLLTLRRVLEENQKSLAASVATLPQRLEAVAKLEASIAGLEKTPNTADPAAKKVSQEVTRKIRPLRIELKRAQIQLSKEQKNQASREAVIQKTGSELSARETELRTLLATLDSARSSLISSRKKYVESMQEFLDSQARLDASLVTALGQTPQTPAAATTPTP